MWVHIRLHKVEKTGTTSEWYLWQIHTDYNYEDIKDWNTLRVYWDREFASADFDWKFLEWDVYNSQRPKDFKQIRDWLKDKEVCTQDRFNFALDLMEKEEDVYFDFNW